MSELRELMARAMRAQGKVDPDEVFAEAEVVDLDDPAGVPYHGEAEQEPLDLDDQEPRGYTYEP